LVIGSSFGGLQGVDLIPAGQRSLSVPGGATGISTEVQKPAKLTAFEQAVAARIVSHRGATASRRLLGRILRHTFR